MSDTLDDSMIIHGLQKKTVYQLRVQGMSAGGDGQMSNPIFFTLEGTQTKVCSRVIYNTVYYVMPLVDQEKIRNVGLTETIKFLKVPYYSYDRTFLTETKKLVSS